MKCLTRLLLQTRSKFWSHYIQPVTKWRKWFD